MTIKFFLPPCLSYYTCVLTEKKYVHPDINTRISSTATYYTVHVCCPNELDFLDLCKFLIGLWPFFVSLRIGIQLKRKCIKPFILRHY